MNKETLEKNLNEAVLHKNVKILYTDDEEINLRSFKRSLRKSFEVMTATSGREALEILRSTPEIGILVTDQRMPEMTGIELLEHTLEEFPDLIRLILTGYSDEEDIKKAVNKCGIFRYLTKPWDEEELENALRSAAEVYFLRKNNQLLMQHLKIQNSVLEAEVLDKTAAVAERDERLDFQNQILEEALEEMEIVMRDVETAANVIELKEQLQDALQRLNDSIAYAKNIQEAILPDKTEIEKYVKSFQCIYWAKDVVSGDFYWAKKTPNALYIALGDCTGHGVPGAFMTVMVSTLLNQIVKSEIEPSCDAALDLLHEQICQALKQETTENRDGLDIALCKITLHEGNFMLEYSGAQRNLYYTREGNIAELPASRFSIGGKTRVIRCYEAHRTEIKPGTRVYAFSDGAAHLPNEDRVKFGSRQILNILQQTLNKTLAEQKGILENKMREHRGSLSDTRDDVTWIGFEV
jgi:serine phosphatase RsbU (regulator of sigma subunit)